MTDNPMAAITIKIPVNSRVFKVSLKAIKAMSNPKTGIKNRYNDNLLASYFCSSQNHIISVRAVPIRPKNITKPMKKPDQVMLLPDSKKKEPVNSGTLPAISCHPVNDMRYVPGLRRFNKTAVTAAPSEVPVASIAPRNA